MLRSTEKIFIVIFLFFVLLCQVIRDWEHITKQEKNKGITKNVFLNETKILKEIGRLLEKYKPWRSRQLKGHEKYEHFRRQQKITKFVIATEARSGSSIFGHCLTLSGTVFYIFEPFKYFKKIGEEDVDQTELQRSGHELLNDILNCEMPFLLKQHFKYMHLEYAKNIRDVKRTCMGNSTKGTKIIRLCDTEILHKTLGGDTALIYLFRDPRAIISSRMQATISTFEVAMDKVCYCALRKLRNVAKYIRSEYAQKQDPEQPPIIIAKYEQFADHPVEYMKVLYKALNLDFNTNVELLIKNQTGTKPDIEKSFDLWRNASEIPHKWKTELSRDDIFIIQNDTRCKKIIDVLGYELIT